MAQFGLPLLDDPVEGHVRPRTAVYGGLAARFNPAGAAGRDLLMRFDLEGEEFWLQVRAGKLARADRDADLDLTFTGSAAALIEVCRGTTDLDGAAPRLTVKGSRATRKVFAKMFPVLTPVGAA